MSKIKKITAFRKYRDENAAALLYLTSSRVGHDIRTEYKKLESTTFGSRAIKMPYFPYKVS